MVCSSEAGITVKVSIMHSGSKILAVSDFEDKTLIRRVEDKTPYLPDFIISCGDLAPEYLSFLRDRLDRPLFYVKGNHDIRYSPSNPVGCDNIHARIIRFNNLNILGLEGSIWYNGGMNQYTEQQMRKIISHLRFSMWLRRGIDIVVTHAPPRHIHDAEDRCHMGFESFVSLINRQKPKLFIHGHIHREFHNREDRITMVGETRVVNTCGYTFLEV